MPKGKQQRSQQRNKDFKSSGVFAEARSKLRFLAEHRGTKAYVEFKRLVDAELVREGFDPDSLRPVRKARSQV